jgi:predicted NACHT family NTPase
LEHFFGQLWRLSNTDMELVLIQGKALMLLDGLDEVTGEAGKQIAKEIKRFSRAYPQVQVVLTCRTQSQESRFDRFDYVEVADFNEQQVTAFAEHCCLSRRSWRGILGSFWELSDGKVRGY